MYKVIVAEDEASERNRILKLLEPFKDDFEVVGCYENGFDAIENGLELEPDLIITDIRMPYVNGIDLIKQAKIELPLVQSIIISGFDSFDYAKEAISLGVVHYLLKPIDSHEMKQSLAEAKEKLDHNFNIGENQKRLEEQERSHQALVQSDDLELLVTLKEIPEDFKKKLFEDGIDLNHPYQRMVYISPDAENTEFTLSQSIATECRLSLKEEFEGFSFYTAMIAPSLIILFVGDHSMDNNYLSTKLKKVLAQSGHSLSTTLSCGVSEEQNGDINYRKMFRHAKRTLEYRTILGKNLVLLFEDLEKDDETRTIGKVDENEYKKLNYYISYGKEKEAISLISSLIQQISTIEYKDSYAFILSNILESILKSCLSLSSFYKDYATPIEVQDHLNELKGKESVIEFLTFLAKRVLKINEDNRISDIKSSYDHIKAYIEANYMNANISIENLAKELGYSVSYISAILKNNGTSFTKLTTNYRMEKAKELLRNQDNKILSISMAVGYSDPYYFSHCFKKYTGVTPDEFRKEK